MKKITLILTILVFLGVCDKNDQLTNSFQTSNEFSIQEVQENSPENVKRALSAFDDFRKINQKNLSTTIKENGFTKAISVCKELAPKIEHSLSEENNMKLYRISDKYRNPNHKPTPDEMKVLEYWMTKLNKKEEIKPVYYQVENKTKVIRPIYIISEMCLNCHGDLNTMKNDVIEVIKKEYPDDKAYGYKLGDLRGACVIEL